MEPFELQHPVQVVCYPLSGAVQAGTSPDMNRVFVSIPQKHQPVVMVFSKNPIQYQHASTGPLLQTGNIRQRGPKLMSRVFHKLSTWKMVRQSPGQT